MAKHVKVTHLLNGTYYINLEEAHWAPRKGQGATIFFNGQEMAIVETCEWLSEQLYGKRTPKHTPEDIANAVWVNPPEAPCKKEAPTEILPAKAPNAKRVRIAKEAK